MPFHGPQIEQLDEPLDESRVSHRRQAGQQLRYIEAWDAMSATPYSRPALFIAGASSNYIRPDHRPIIRGLFPRARFVVLKNAGHWLHADNPSGFVAVVEAFLTASA